MELNRVQIIMALEWLEWLRCNARYSDEAEIELTISLIKELTEEKEKLGLLIDELEKEKRELWEERNRIYNDLQDWKAIAEQYQKQFEDCAEDRARLTEENERLRAIPEQMKERLQAYFGTYVLGYKIPLSEALKAVNQIAKEMLEGK